MTEYERTPGADAAPGSTDPELARLQEGIEHTRAGMSATIASLETKLSSEEIRDKLTAELTNVEERVRVVVRAQLGEAKAPRPSRAGRGEEPAAHRNGRSRTQIKRGLGEARDAVKEDVNRR